MPTDIPKLYTAFAEWLSCLGMFLAHHHLHRHDRFDSNLAIMAGSLSFLSIIQIICGMLSNALWLLGMLSALVVMWIFLYYMLDISPSTALYTLARAFMWAEFSASLEWQLDRFYVPDKWKESLPFSLFFCLGIFAFMTILLYYLENHYLKEGISLVKTGVSLKDILFVWAVTILFFALSNLSYVKISSPFRGSDLKEIFNIRTIVDLSGVIMLELLYIQKADADRKREIDAIRNVLNNQYMQFRQSQENIDLINRKYHDLKHHLLVLRTHIDDKKKQEFIDEIEKEIQIYDTEYKTGNPVLDTILITKGNLCLKHGIQMNVVADGTLLKNMHVGDLATLFGNALDNAIEHEIQIQDQNKRMIHITISAKSRMTSIIIENYFKGKLLNDGENLITTKLDKQNHGYGLKSIRHTVNKYGGIMTVGVEDCWFRLKILFPSSA